MAVKLHQQHSCWAGAIPPSPQGVLPTTYAAPLPLAGHATSADLRTQPNPNYILFLLRPPLPPADSAGSAAPHRVPPGPRRLRPAPVRAPSRPPPPPHAPPRPFNGRPLAANGRRLPPSDRAPALTNGSRFSLDRPAPSALSLAGRPVTQPPQVAEALSWRRGRR